MKSRILESKIEQHKTQRQRQIQKIDKFYTPLKHALEQSSKQKTEATRYSRSYSMQNMRCSQVSNKFWKVNPQQAQYLTNSIFVPSGKTLIPTTNYQKVEGKKFVAIKLSTVQRPPINEQQLRIRQSNGNLTPRRIIYEYGQQDEAINKKSQASQQFTGKFVSQFKLSCQNSIVQKKNQPKHSRSKSLINQLSPHQQFVTPIKTSIKIPKSSNTNHPKIIQKQKSNEYGLNYKPTQKYSAMSNSHIFNHQNVVKIRKDNPLSQPTLIHMPNSQQIYAYPEHDFVKQDIAAHHVMQDDFNRKQNCQQIQDHWQGFMLRDQANTQYISENLHLFSTNTAKLHKKQKKNHKNEQKSEPFKYNLFSIIDYPINNKCFKFGPCQLVAAKKAHPWHCN